MPDTFTFSDLRFPSDGSVIDDLSLSVSSGERVVLYGPNGGGKTTILRLIAGTIGDSEISNDTAYLPQTPHMFRGTTRANLLLGLVGDEAGAALRLASDLRVHELLDADARSLSGGQAQRVALARTLASQSSIVLLDEPLAPINAVDRGYVARLIRERTEGRSLVCVTHSIETVVALGDRLMIVDGGVILQDGAPGDVLNNPGNDAVAGIIGVGNVIEGTVTGIDDGMASVDCGTFEMMVVVDAGVGDTVRIRFGAESVALYADPPHGGSQRNAISGTVREVIRRGRLLEVIVDAGVSIAALVTPGALDALEMAVGDPVWAAIKTASLSAMRISR
ncbi:MAG: ABC transporter ATP-binding protein [Actinomycetota bacterium]